MPRRFANALVGVRNNAVPRGRINGVMQGGSVRAFTAVINLAAAGNGLLTTADEALLCQLPAGYKFLFGILQNDTALGATAQVAIGTNPVHASNGQYRASAIKNAVGQEIFGLTSGMDDEPVAAPTDIFLTVGAANLPTTGTIVVVIFAAAAT